MNEIIDEKYIDANTLKEIKEHAKQYDTSPDKREFLKEVGAYEQKLILMTSSHPCDVLRFLSEINSKITKIVLESIDSNFILNILNKFTADDKKWFYRHYPNADIVNKFITSDDLSKQYIEQLPLERKVEIIASSTTDTYAASKEVYSTLSESDIMEITTNDSIPSVVTDKITDLQQEAIQENNNIVDNIIPEATEVINELETNFDDNLQEDNKDAEPQEEKKEEEKIQEEKKEEEKIQEEKKEEKETITPGLLENVLYDKKIDVENNFIKASQEEEVKIIKEIKEQVEIKENSTLQR